MRYDIDPKTLKKAAPRELPLERDITPLTIEEPPPRYKSKAKEQLAMLQGQKQSIPNDTSYSQEGDWNLRPLSIAELESIE